MSTLYVTKNYKIDAPFPAAVKAVFDAIASDENIKYREFRNVEFYGDEKEFFAAYSYIDAEGAGQTLQVSINKLNYKTGKVTPISEQSDQVDAQKTVRIAIDCVLLENEIILCDLQNEDIQDRCFYKEGKLEMVKADCLRVIEKTENSITVEATEYVQAVALEGNGVFSDSYFSLLPGQRRTVSFTPIQGEETEITCIGYTLA